MSWIGDYVVIPASALLLLFTVSAYSTGRLSYDLAMLVRRKASDDASMRNEHEPLVLTGTEEHVPGSGYSAEAATITRPWGQVPDLLTSLRHGIKHRMHRIRTSSDSLNFPPSVPTIYIPKARSAEARPGDDEYSSTT